MAQVEMLCLVGTRQSQGSGFDTRIEGKFCGVLVLFWTVCHSITIQSRRKT